MKPQKPEAVRPRKMYRVTVKTVPIRPMEEPNPNAATLTRPPCSAVPHAATRRLRRGDQRRWMKPQRVHRYELARETLASVAPPEDERMICTRNKMREGEKLNRNPKPRLP